MACRIQALPLCDAAPRLKKFIYDCCEYEAPSKILVVIVKRGGSDNIFCEERGREGRNSGKCCVEGGVRKRKFVETTFCLVAGIVVVWREKGGGFLVIVKKAIFAYIMHASLNFFL